MDTKNIDKRREGCVNDFMKESYNLLRAEGIDYSIKCSEYFIDPVVGPFIITQPLCIRSLEAYLLEVRDAPDPKPLLPCRTAVRYIYQVAKAMEGLQKVRKDRASTYLT